MGKTKQTKTFGVPEGKKKKKKKNLSVYFILFFLWWNMIRYRLPSGGGSPGKEKSGKGVNFTDIL